MSKNIRIVIIFGICIKSYLVKYLLYGIWLKMKFIEITWGEVKMVREKREGDTSEREIVIITNVK